MGHIPYGYRIKNGMAVIDEDEADAVVNLFEYYLDGYGLQAAANAAGIPVNHCQAKKMMQNKKYLGTDYYPAIISKEMMDKAEDMRQKRATRLGRNFEPKEIVKKTACKHFKTRKADNHYMDPYRQAQYIFSLIEEVQMDG